MDSKDTTRTFFILYSNGDTFYFTLEQNSEIYCTRFKNAYEYSRKIKMPGAHILEFVGNSFNLKSSTQETIYSLDNYYNEVRNIISIPEQLPTIEKLYIDEDVCAHLLSEGKITFDEEAGIMLGLLEKTIPEEQSKGFARVKKA